LTSTSLMLVLIMPLVIVGNSAVKMRFFLLLLFCYSAPTTAQQAPMATVTKFDPAVANYRTDVCARQRELYEEKVKLEDALRGLQLSVAMTNYAGVPNEKYFFALGDDGKIKPDEPGLFVVIMDEIARRAGFQWRNSFVAIPPLDASTDGNKTWTDLLEWEVNRFDIAADYWGKGTARMARGISFPKGWYDGSVILAWSSAPSDGGGSKRFWSFLRPFDNLVWLGIVAAIM